MIEFERKPDGGLNAWIETYEAMGGDETDAEMLCLLLELRRRRETQTEAERERDELRGEVDKIKTLSRKRLSNACKAFDRAEVAEAEIARRDAAAGEPVAYQIHSDLEGWRECTPERYAEMSARPLVDGKHSGAWSVRKLYTDAPPAVLPPEMFMSDAIKGKVTSDFMDGANWMRQQCLALGAQQQEVVELDNVFSVNVAGVAVRVVLLKDVSTSLDAANVKYEVKP